MILDGDTNEGGNELDAPHDATETPSQNNGHVLSLIDTGKIIVVLIMRM